jgi:hypothetical protein
MRFPGKAALASLTVAIVLMAAVGVASARRFSLNERSFQVLWPVPLHNGGGGEQRAECPITLGGSFHSATISKVSGVLIGYIHRATVGPPESCVRGGMTILQETLPWHVRYQSFSGALPRIVSVTIQVIGAGFRVTEQFFSQFCLFRSTSANPIRLIVQLSEAGVVTAIRADETSTIPMTGTEFCFETATFSGSERLTRPNGGEFVIRLVQ